MRNRFVLYIAAILCIFALASCSTDGDEPYYAAPSKMDFSDAIALALLGNPAQEENGAVLYALDARGKLAPVEVELASDNAGDKVRAHILTKGAVNLHDDCFALLECSYRSIDNPSQMIPWEEIPASFSYIIVRKADCGMFGFGDNELLKKIINTVHTPRSVKINDEEFLILADYGEAMIKLNGDHVSCKNMFGEGIYNGAAVYSNNRIYSTMKANSLAASIYFDDAPTKFLSAESFGSPVVCSYFLLADGLGAIRKSHQSGNTYLSFNIIDCDRSGEVSITEIARLEGPYGEYDDVYGCYDGGGKIILQNHYSDLSVIDKDAGTWEPFTPDLGNNWYSFEISPANYYQGCLWGVNSSNWNNYPTQAWFSTKTLRCGSITLNYDFTGIYDIRKIKDFDNGHMYIFGTRGSDGANLVIKADIATAGCAIIFSDTEEKISTLVPLD